MVPIGRTPLSLFAGYFALFAPLILPAPLVLIVGIWTLKNLKKHPGKLGRGRAIFAIVMGGVFTAALLIGVILVNLHIGQK